MPQNEYGKAVSTECPHCPSRYVTFPSDTDMGPSLLAGGTTTRLDYDKRLMKLKRTRTTSSY